MNRKRSNRRGHINGMSSVVWGIIKAEEQEERIICALMEAAFMIGKDYKEEAVLDFVEVKYSAYVNNIRKIVAERVASFLEERETFGFVVSTGKKRNELIRRAIVGEKED